jgi:predicted nucleotidyltransferase
MTNEIRASLRRVCEVLNRHEVNYLIIGGMAVGFHGYPRATADLDFWYEPTIENFHRIIASLQELGVDTSSLEKLVFDPKKTFLRIPQNNFRLEFLPAIPGVESFRASNDKASETNLDGVVVKVLSYDDLIKNKRAVGRAVDQNDVEELERRRGTADG